MLGTYLLPDCITAGRNASYRYISFKGEGNMFHAVHNNLVMGEDISHDIPKALRALLDATSTNTSREVVSREITPRHVTGGYVYG